MNIENMQIQIRDTSPSFDGDFLLSVLFSVDDDIFDERIGGDGFMERNTNRSDCYKIYDGRTTEKSGTS